MLDLVVEVAAEPIIEGGLLNIAGCLQLPTMKYVREKQILINLNCVFICIRYYRFSLFLLLRGNDEGHYKVSIRKASSADPPGCGGLR